MGDVQKELAERYPHIPIFLFGGDELKAFHARVCKLIPQTFESTLTGETRMVLCKEFISDEQYIVDHGDGYYTLNTIWSGGTSPLIEDLFFKNIDCQAGESL
jgi:hypothetical protein